MTSNNAYFQLRKGALSSAVEEWYEQSDDETKKLIDEMSDTIIDNAKVKAEKNVMLGRMGAREIIGALIAHDQKMKLKPK